MAFNKGQFVIARTTSAGVFAGILVGRKKQEVELQGARRLWYWSGAASLSELAVRGVKRPGECKFPVAVDRVLLTEVIELIEMTYDAWKSVCEVPEWSA